jgi:hypothetical protein
LAGVSLVYTKTESGLLVASEGASDERAVARALKDHDPDLRLVPQQDGWRVYRYAGPDRPADFILYWGDGEGPWPLSHRLVDEVKRHDRNTQAHVPSPEELNAKAEAERRKQDAAMVEDIVDDNRHKMNGRIACLKPSVALRMARDKERRRRRGRGINF